MVWQVWRTFPLLEESIILNADRIPSIWHSLVNNICYPHYPPKKEHRTLFSKMKQLSGEKNWMDTYKKNDHQPRRCWEKSVNSNRFTVKNKNKKKNKNKNSNKNILELIQGNKVIYLKKNKYLYIYISHTRK